ncbi:hypothetical protein T12_9414 [Trichinella patagoniensis]|uniref:ShKT domain-containing protein n=2 Tax=Trichinella TaxID=6333 RepID=A0A0V0ZUN2_9BILA|nr:hypothetical protein T12_9414 [Trichinella patagoniensis]
MSLWSTFMGFYALGSVFICITVDGIGHYAEMSEVSDGESLHSLLCGFCCSLPEKHCNEIETYVPCSVCSCCAKRLLLTKNEFPRLRGISFMEWPQRKACPCPHNEDNDFKCSFWAHLGECERIPGFMVTMCPVSCGICCV